MTVLNAPDDLAAKVENERPSLKELGALSFNYLNGSNYIMTTSSYYDGDAAKHDKFYNATYIEDGKLIPEAQLPSMDATDKISTDKLVEIYVERLAAKYSLDDASKNIKSTLEITISGSDNKDGSDDTAAGDAATATKIEIAVTGFGVTNTEGVSYLSKNIDGWSNTVAPSTAWETNNNKWNVPGDFRSHWAKSINYDNALTTDFVTKTFGQVEGKYLAYSNETTKAVANLYTSATDHTLNRQLTPCFVITAEAKISGAAKTLVEYNGLYYYENSFKNYVLDKLNRTDKLNFYKLVDASSETTEDGNKTVTIEGKTYKQIGADDIKFNRANPDVKNNQVVLIYDDTKSDKPEGDKPEAEKLYAKITVGGKVTMEEVTVESLNTNLKSFFSNTGNYAAYFNGGKMYYTVPVEHLLGSDDSSEFKVENEGEYGTVRNHWYQLTLRKISNMGHGVFNPDDVNDSDIIEIEKPNEKYGLSCRINILSWKLVLQNADL